jgi:hypothetical protein
MDPDMSFDRHERSEVMAAIMAGIDGGAVSPPGDDASETSVRPVDASGSSLSPVSAQSRHDRLSVALAF